MSARRATIALVAAATLAACGCSTVGNGHVVALNQAEAQALLVPGRTTQADVRRALGEGAIIRFQSGRETWHYFHRDGVAAGWDDVPYIGLVTSRMDRPTQELVLLFDTGGVLMRWSLQLGRSGRRDASP